MRPCLLMHDASSSKELVADQERNEGVHLSRRLDGPMQRSQEGEDLAENRSLAFHR